MNSFFVTGTDTDVGKTCVSAALANYFCEKDIDVGVMKPFASGYKSSVDSVSEDVEILMKMNINNIHKIQIYKKAETKFQFKKKAKKKLLIKIAS